MSEKLFTPAKLKHDGVLVVAPYPFASTEANVTPRMQATADLLGARILGMQAPGTGKTETDWREYESDFKNPDRFWRPMQGEVRAARSYAQDFDQVIGWGDSGRAVNVMAMALGTGPDPIFDRLLIRDGVNLRGPLTTGQAESHFTQYQRDGERGKQPLTDDIPPAALESSPDPLLRARSEMTYYMNLLRGTYGMDMATQLAGSGSWAHLPIRSVGLTHSFTGSAPQAEAFASGLESARAGAADYVGGLAVVGQVWANVEEGYHSDLLRPGMAARHLEETLALTPAYTN
jgi:hypothetical protein